MKNYIRKLTTRYTTRATGVLPVTLPALLLVGLLVGLLVMMVSACTTFTKKTLHTAALKDYLLLLQTRILAKSDIDPEAERRKMEVLQNNIKSSSDQEAISRNMQLKDLFSTTCKWMQSPNYGKDRDQHSWLQLRQLMLSFNETYFFPNNRAGLIGVRR